MKKIVFAVLALIVSIGIMVIMPSVGSAYFDDNTCIFIDIHSNTHGIGDVGPQIAIDFPMYSFNSEYRKLTSIAPLDLTPETKVVLGQGSSITGTAGGGVASGLTLYDNILVIDKFNIEPDGTLNYKYNDKWIVLRVGESWIEKTESESPYGGTLVKTFKVVNYGFINKSDISAPNIPTPSPTPPDPTPLQTPVGRVGDVNGDGTVNSVDLMLVKRYVLGIIVDFPSENGFWAADVNGDEIVNSTDYVIIKKYLLRMIDKLPKEVNNQEL